MELVGPAIPESERDEFYSKLKQRRVRSVVVDPAFYSIDRLVGALHDIEEITILSDNSTLATLFADAFFQHRRAKLVHLHVYTGRFIHWIPRGIEKLVVHFIPLDTDAFRKACVLFEIRLDSSVILNVPDLNSASLRLALA